MGNKLLVILVVLGVLAGIGLMGAFGYVMYRTIQNSGEAAIASMSEEEKQILAKLKTIVPGTPRDRVIKEIGLPDSELLGEMKYEAFAGDMWSQLKVRTEEGRVESWVWLKMGSFVYASHDIPEEEWIDPQVREDNQLRELFEGVEQPARP